ncbi:molybdate ABC transporter substrate-binding protein [Campylobacter corcagiensis]|uniref:Molybdate ABC transporter substrate-binding protein n=1 Tax=Campylobacter corcagiensis TaxID=1448857 RepID=A0A7M1LHJ1_9BACT|nr:molybdate ABC transporter substrate-binding protein [Campylobacter corcagiensis]QKF65396.1 molybdenum ABC transporter ModABC, periplasmic molybdate-binding protein [Campylobacter corcagiensis]QOQ88028.1 molybdate ABC transporter substrate-binding protein [Campylobacter corcagiensis]
MRKLIILALSVLAINAAEIRVAAAANIGYVFDELRAEFLKDRPNDKIEATLGSSGKLVAQIKAGADYAIFMAANMDFAQGVYEDGLATAPAEIYTRGVLVSFSTTPKKWDENLEYLKDKNIQKIAIANNKTAPYGIAAYEAFGKAGVLNDIENKLVQADSVGNVLPLTIAQADVGFMPRSGLVGKDEYKEGEHFVNVAENLYTPLDQGMVILNKYKDDELTNAFYNFLKSDKAKEIFLKNGYK